MTTRGKAQEFKNLKLDADFFSRMLSQKENASEESRDFDVYLMEKSVMPLLLQGLDALSRHTDKMNTKGGNSPRQPFNPLVWLAQYLLRNHPRHVKDHRTPMYEKFSELANIERGRRCLLRRKGQVEEVWQNMVDMNGGCPLSLDDLPQLFKNLDEKWFLDRALMDKVPQDFSKILIEKAIPDEGAPDEVLFDDFFKWFEGFVRQNDILRAAAFTAAEKKQIETEHKAKRAQEDAERRERAMQEALEKRSELEEQFETVTADMYISTDLARIMNKGAVIEGVEEKEGGPPLQGEHIMLIRLMLSIWGCPIDDGSDGDVWNDQALASWKQWLQERDMKTTNPVDKASLRRLIDKDEFQEYLQTAFPVNVNEDCEDDYVKQIVEVKCLVEDELETIVEAVDEDTGELLHLVLPTSEIQGLRQRLETATSAHPVLAMADRVGGRILEIMPQQ